MFNTVETFRRCAVAVQLALKVSAVFDEPMRESADREQSYLPNPQQVRYIAT